MHEFKLGKWEQISNWDAESFICWNCGKEIASEKAYYSGIHGGFKSFIYVCPNCNAPIIIDDEKKKYYCLCLEKK